MLYSLICSCSAINTLPFNIRTKCNSITDILDGSYSWRIDSYYKNICTKERESAPYVWTENVESINGYIQEKESTCFEVNASECEITNISLVSSEERNGIRYQICWDVKYTECIEYDLNDSRICISERKGTEHECEEKSQIRHFLKYPNVARCITEKNDVLLTRKDWNTMEEINFSVNVENIKIVHPLPSGVFWRHMDNPSMMFFLSDYQNAHTFTNEYIPQPWCLMMNNSADFTFGSLSFSFGNPLSNFIKTSMITTSNTLYNVTFFNCVNESETSKSMKNENECEIEITIDLDEDMPEVAKGCDRIKVEKENDKTYLVNEGESCSVKILTSTFVDIPTTFVIKEGKKVKVEATHINCVEVMSDVLYNCTLTNISEFIHMPDVMDKTTSPQPKLSEYIWNAIVVIAIIVVLVISVIVLCVCCKRCCVKKSKKSDELDEHMN